jgi:phosphoribosylamine--glycine ligase
MGDPETEVVVPRLKTDFVDLFKAVANGTLDQVPLEIDDRAATTVMSVAGGYPEAYNKGDEIKGIDEVLDQIVFQAGTTTKDGKIVTNGGRVLAVTAYGSNFREALNASYEGLSKISFKDMYFRKDLGFDL